MSSNRINVMDVTEYNNIGIVLRSLIENTDAYFARWMVISNAIVRNSSSVWIQEKIEKEKHGHLLYDYSDFGSSHAL